MANLIDIGKSGLTAYRQSLAVTGQNIANIDTDGYKRREATVSEVISSKGDVTSIASQTGLGVRIEGIRRSFDEFLLNKARIATSNAGMAESFSKNIGQIEDILLPGDANLGTAIGSFFSGLQEIANNPTDLSARTVALEKGRMIADSFVQLSTLIQQVADGTLEHAGREATEINILTSQLANINQQISASSSLQPNNSLFDTRDKVIDRISELVAVTVSLTDKGAAKLQVGESTAGPILVEANRARELGVNSSTEGVNYFLNSATGPIYTSQVTKGSIAGLGQAFAATKVLIEEVDELAFDFARELNESHKKGIDLDGNAGGDLFRHVNVSILANQSNRGDTSAELTSVNHSLLNHSKVTFEYNSDQEVWSARNSSGAILASGRERVSLPGAEFIFRGSPANFDQFIFDPSSGSARNLAFALARPQEFAAASPTLVSADASNQSDALMKAVAATSTVNTGLESVDKVFSNNLSSISSTQFLKGGAVAVIPANATSIDLLSLGKQSDVKFNVNDSEVSAVSSLTIELGTSDNSGNAITKTITFSLDATKFTDTKTWTDLNHISNLLNQGAISGIVSGTGASVTLASLGGFASGANGNLAISLSEDTFNNGSIQLSTGRNLAGITSSREATVSNIQIFTREGRHIAGSTPESTWNTVIAGGQPFNVGALYNNTYLNASGSNGYLGVNVETSFTSSNTLLKTESDATSAAITYKFLDGIDTDEASPDGLSASAATSSYSTTVGNLSSTITGVDIQGKTAKDVATAAISGLRTTAPTAYAEGKLSVKTSFSFTLANVGLTESNIHSLGSAVVSYGGAVYTFKSNGSTISVGGGADLTRDLIYTSGTTTVSGSVINLPANNDSFVVEFEGQNYAIKMTDGEVTVSGGEPGRLNAYYDASSKLQISSNEGTVSKSTITLVSDANQSGNSDAAERFGFIDGTDVPTTYYSNQPWIGVNFKTGGNVAEGSETIQVDLVGSSAGSTDDLSFNTASLSAGDDDEIMTAIKTAFDNLTDKKGYSATLANNKLWFTRFDGTNFSFEATEGGTVGSSAISLEARLWPADASDLTSGVATSATTIGYAFTAQTFDLIRDNDKIKAKALNGASPPTISATAKSLVGQRLILTNLPDEELIIGISNAGAKNLAVQYDLQPEGTPTVFRDISVKVVDANNNQVEFIDKETNTSLATRTLDSDQSTTARSYNITFSGSPSTNDLFYIENNADGIGDNGAIQDILDLQNVDSKGIGGFQYKFNMIVSKLGAKVEAGNLAFDAAETLRETSVAAEASFSGVNLDTEASNLIQQQQAYQASARILSTAREIFNTLLDSV